MLYFLLSEILALESSIPRQESCPPVRSVQAVHPGTLNSVQTTVESSPSGRGSSLLHIHVKTEQTLSYFSELKFFYQDGASHLFPEAW
jgi:hypothetical protein